MVFRKSASIGVFAFAAAVGLVCAAEKTEEVKIKGVMLAVPSDWKQEEPSNRLRLAQFKVNPAEGDKEPAELVVSSFDGGGGGVDPNLKRWIGQFEANGRQSKTTMGESSQGKYYVSDLTGTYKKPDGPPVAGKTKPVPGSRSIGVILEAADKNIYFLKLTGPEKTVTAAADGFRKSFGGTADKETAYEVK
jgi:gluconolactonase